MPCCMRWPPALSGTRVWGTPCMAQLPGGQLGALVARPGFIHPDVHREARVVRRIDGRGGRAMVHTGQPAGVAVGEHVHRAPPLRAEISWISRRPCRPMAAQAATSSSQIARPPRRGAPGPPGPSRSRARPPASGRPPMPDSRRSGAWLSAVAGAHADGRASLPPRRRPTRSAASARPQAAAAPMSGAPPHMHVADRGGHAFRRCDILDDEAVRQLSLIDDLHHALPLRVGPDGPIMYAANLHDACVCLSKEPSS